MRLRPYKTAENKIDGVVMTLIDVDQMKRTIGEAEEARDFAQAVIETAHEPLAVLGSDLRVQSANEAFYALFKTTRAQIQDRPLFDAIPDEREVLGDFRKHLEGVLPSSGGLTDFRIKLEVPDAGSSLLVVNARQIASGARAYPLILLSIRLAG
jgi:two-component system CheB/CheR fusion protein